MRVPGKAPDISGAWTIARARSCTTRACVHDRLPVRPARKSSESADLAPAGEPGSRAQRAAGIDETNRCRGAATNHGEPVYRLGADSEPVPAVDHHVEDEAVEWIVAGSDARAGLHDREMPAVPTEEAAGGPPVERDREGAAAAGGRRPRRAATP